MSSFASCQTSSQTLTSCVLPLSVSAASSRVRIRSHGASSAAVVPDVMICPPCATPTSRAATLTESP
jgi:hypothetical protein